MQGISRRRRLQRCCLPAAVLPAGRGARDSGGVGSTAASTGQPQLGSLNVPAHWPANPTTATQSAAAAPPLEAPLPLHPHNAAANWVCTPPAKCKGPYRTPTDVCWWPCTRTTSNQPQVLSGRRCTGSTIQPLGCALTLRNEVYSRYAPRPHPGARLAGTSWDSTCNLRCI
jgi:hypothetical protein